MGIIKKIVHYVFAPLLSIIIGFIFLSFIGLSFDFVDSPIDFIIVSLLFYPIGVIAAYFADYS